MSHTMNPNEHWTIVILTTTRLTMTSTRMILTATPTTTTISSWSLKESFSHTWSHFWWMQMVWFFFLPSYFAGLKNIVEEFWYSVSITGCIGCSPLWLIYIWRRIDFINLDYPLFYKLYNPVYLYVYVCVLYFSHTQFYMNDCLNSN